jgi:hypothetical protein
VEEAPEETSSLEPAEAEGVADVPLAP